MMTSTTRGGELGRTDTADSPSSWWHGPLGYRLPLELAVCGTFFWLYRYIRALTRDDGVEAFDNARHVMRLERAYGVFNEAHVQDLLMGSRGLVELLNRYYVIVHFTATTGFLMWAYVRHHRSYVTIRNVFLTVTGAALVIHVFVPLAPPRMFPTVGFVDTLHLYGPQIYPTDLSQSVANQFAAVPSLHFGWAVLVAGGFVAIKRSRLSLLAFAHPVITLIAIVGTGNHYWLDAAVALLLILLVVAIRVAFRARRRIIETVAVAYRYATHSMI